MDGEGEPDQSKWSQYLQFSWALLGDLRRLRRLVAVFVVVMAGYAIVKGSFAALYYDLMQHVPAWGKTLAVSVGVGGGVTGSVGFPLYRKWLRVREERPLPGRSAAESLAQEPGENKDNALGEPREAERKHPGDGDPGPDPGEA